MTIEQLWHEMEAEGGTNAAWLIRFARPQTGHQLMVALEQTTRVRALLVRACKISTPPRREWPECQGLELISIALDSQSYFGVKLRDIACSDVFTALAEDVALHVAAASDASEAAAALMGRLRQWQQFLTAAHGTMSLEAQRGLWGELHVMREHFLPFLGNDTAVFGWKASAAAHQDFQFLGGAVEVKTTTAKQPQSVRITSERQLDDTGVGVLFLDVVVLDEREVPVGECVQGESLTALISQIRSKLSTDLCAMIAFNDRLLERGWLDGFDARYDGRRWTVRQEFTYRIRPDFPRLVESELPLGVGDVNFALSLAACEQFAVPISEMLKAISSTTIH